APVACFWTGPKVVPESVTVDHMAEVGERMGHRLLFWDNYPVNDLTMSDEMHIGPLTGRDPRLPERVHGHLANPLLQEELSFIPLATCFDYARDPKAYDPETSWEAVVTERFGAAGLEHWRALRLFCEKDADTAGAATFSEPERAALAAAHGYLLAHRSEGWCRELEPWRERLEHALR
ncbi:MAG: beta-N-acetylglucosaminidase domain-containing protein, partial [Deltaproteobacteria bacterium]|nr:beta-N-acetylglucosaminidase domain-containing protein [Deltaproteobacteria bacterium]